jgi:hypothetical protein
MTHKLSKEQEALLAKIVESGEYESAEDAMTAILEQELDDALEFEALRAALRIGLDQRANGEFVEYTAEWRAEKLRQVLERTAQPRASA